MSGGVTVLTRLGLSKLAVYSSREDRTELDLQVIYLEFVVSE